MSRRGSTGWLRRFAQAAILPLVLVAGVIVAPNPAQAVGSYDNAKIADYALTKVGQWGGQCRVFVNNVVSYVSGGSQNLTVGSSNYFDSFLREGGVRITDKSQLKKGDIVQRYVSSNDLHTWIIVGYVSGDTFNVVDSNSQWNEIVRNYNRTFTLSDTTRAYRMGTVVTAPPPPPASVDANGDRVAKFGGDFNGDGYGDVVAYSVYPDGAGFNVYLYKGSANGALQDPVLQMYLGPTAGGWDFRWSKSVVTNVNGDAYQDLVIFHRGPNDEIGRHILLGSASGLQSSNPSLFAMQYPNQGGWYWSNLYLAGGGDINGDGFGDVVAYSLYPDGAGFNVYLYTGSASNGLQGPAYQMYLGPSAGGWDFRNAKYLTVNVNGDAYQDLVIFHRGPNDEIVRHVLKGSATGLQASDPNMVVWQTPSQGGWYWSNLKVAGGGDMNGDGYGDVAAFSRNPDGSFNAYLYPGSTTGLQTPQFQSALGSVSGGWSFSGSKPVTTDANGDGKMDLVVLHKGPNDEIVRHVQQGSTSGLQPSDPATVVWQSPSSGGWYWSKVFVG